jgi:uncharacterized protein (DUF1697 family)
MEKFISILRGINVSGHRLINMKALQELYKNLGFTDIKTYIQSGNVVFQSKLSSPGSLEKQISQEILKVFGFEVPVLVIQRNDLMNISANNPFIQKGVQDITKLHVTFLSGEPEPGLTGKIDKEQYSPDEFEIQGKAVYLFCPGGYGNTKLSNTFFEKKLKLPATTRNWKTILELLKLSE